MKRARRSHLIRMTREYLADLVLAMLDNGDGIYNLGETQEEHDLVAATTVKIATAIRERGK